jgi:hypothetical protein
LEPYVRRFLVGFGFICLTLSACATKPEIPFDRASSDRIKTIGIVTPSFPNGPSVVLASSVGQSFGIIGALVDAGLRSNRESKFNAVLDQQHFQAQNYFLGDVRKSLEQEGFKVVSIDAKRDKADFLTQYPNAAGSNVDAFLDLVVKGYGYLASGISNSSPYRPFFMVGARLVNATNQSVLMQDVIVYNPLNGSDKAVSIAPDPDMQFVDFDTLTANGPKAVAGLAAAEDESAKALGKLLH